MSVLIELGAYLIGLYRWHANGPLVENSLKDGLLFPYNISSNPDGIYTKCKM